MYSDAVTRASTATNGAEGNGASDEAFISVSGRFVLFRSAATNLADVDTNGFVDLFLKDLDTRVLKRVTVAKDGSEANEISNGSAVSSDGMFVYFESMATNLTGAPDANGLAFDVFEKNMITGDIRVVSTNAAGAQGNGNSLMASISTNGRYLVFESAANNLVAGDTNGKDDIFRKDLQSGEIVRVSTSAVGAQANDASRDARVSANGRFVTFASDATNLVAGVNGSNVYRKDLVTGAVTVSASADGQAANANSFARSMSADGRWVAYESLASNLVPQDTNNKLDVFLVDANIVQNRIAIDELRYVEVNLFVGAATSVGIAWGDGTSETATPSNGTVSLAHAYAAAGVKSSVMTVNDGWQSWAVPYTMNTTALQMTRDTTLSDTLSGGAGNDVLTGDTFGNILFGNAGNDTLDGQAGADRMEGGIGNDVYIVDNALDVVTETAGNGTDLVQTSINYALRANVENLAARGAFGLSLSGNDLDNAILGGIGNDKLYGRLGKDALTGGAGKDVFVFDSAVAKKKNANIDNIVDFSVKDDTI